MHLVAPTGAAALVPAAACVPRAKPGKDLPARCARSPALKGPRDAKQRRATALRRSNRSAVRRALAEKPRARVRERVRAHRERKRARASHAAQCGAEAPAWKDAAAALQAAKEAHTFSVRSFPYVVFKDGDKWGGPVPVPLAVRRLRTRCRYLVKALQQGNKGHYAYLSSTDVYAMLHRYIAASGGPAALADVYNIVAVQIACVCADGHLVRARVFVRGASTAR